MNLRKTLNLVLGLFLLLVGDAARSEEQHSVLTALNSTTLSGYVDTSTSWWVGTGLPGRTFSPANDSIPDAIAVETNSIVLPGNLTDSTLDSGEPFLPHQTGSVWYKWTVNQAGVARISTNTITPVSTTSAISLGSALSSESIFYPGGGFTTGVWFFNLNGVHWISDVFAELGYEEWRATVHPIPYQRWWSQLVVYRCVQITETEARFEFVQRGQSLEFDVQAGEVFWVGVEVYENQPAYEGQPELPSLLPANLFIDLTPRPLNDSFASGLSIADSAGGLFSSYTLASTREPGELNPGGAFSAPSVWFHYTAATFGTVTIGSSENLAPFAIYTGSEISNLRLVAKAESGALSFFGEEGKVYHIAVYHSAPTALGFSLTVTAPQYRLYETTLDALFPNGLTPHFHGVRGVTVLLYAKNGTGWDLVEVEPIVAQAADLLIRPISAVDDKLRVITIDEPLPSPHVVFSTVNGVVTVNLAGISGQTCAVSYSTDLVNWSDPQVITLDSASTFLRVLRQTAQNFFFRATQSLPLAPATVNPIGVQVQTGGSGGNIPTPPVPSP